MLCDYKPDSITICGIEACEFTGPLGILSEHNCLKETKRIMKEELEEYQQTSQKALLDQKKRI